MQPAEKQLSRTFSVTVEALGQHRYALEIDGDIHYVDQQEGDPLLHFETPVKNALRRVCNDLQKQLKNTDKGETK